MNTVKFKINGLHCMGCVRTSQSLIEEVRGVKSVSVKDPQGETEVTGEGEVDMKTIETVLKDAGYTISR